MQSTPLEIVPMGHKHFIYVESQTAPFLHSLKGIHLLRLQNVPFGHKLFPNLQDFPFQINGGKHFCGKGKQTPFLEYSPILQVPFEMHLYLSHLVPNGQLFE